MKFEKTITMIDFKNRFVGGSCKAKDLKAGEDDEDESDGFTRGEDR